VCDVPTCTVPSGTRGPVASRGRILVEGVVSSVSNMKLYGLRYSYWVGEGMRSVYYYHTDLKEFSKLEQND
jgi:hypothetical protein